MFYLETCENNPDKCDDQKNEKCVLVISGITMTNIPTCKCKDGFEMQYLPDGPQCVG